MGAQASPLDVSEAHESLVVVVAVPGHEPAPLHPAQERCQRPVVGDRAVGDVGDVAHGAVLPSEDTVVNIGDVHPRTRSILTALTNCNQPNGARSSSPISAPHRRGRRTPDPSPHGAPKPASALLFFA